MDDRELLKLYKRIEYLENWVHAQQRFGPAYKGVVADFMYLPYLRGFWPMVSISEASVTYDYSGQGRNLFMQGGIGLNETSNNNAWYFDFDGTDDYLNRSDEAGLDITGNLTMGGWFWFDSLARLELLMSKIGASGNFAYYIQKQQPTNADKIQFTVTSNGTATTSVLTTSTVSASAWYFVVSRYTTSTELAIFLNTEKNTNTTSIPASIFNSSAAFEIGRYGVGPAQFLDGRAALCFITGSNLSDATIYNLYHRSWPLFANST